MEISPGQSLSIKDGRVDASAGPATERNELYFRQGEIMSSEQHVCRCEYLVFCMHAGIHEINFIGSRDRLARGGGGDGGGGCQAPRTCSCVTPL